ncbi:GNAT family N-acyltransferase [Fodinicurvata sp. EGI_FJ10296]|uniref:GNAT family N-acetyltransferase n=1 Tax=Fodinicurvata sp. EGI_FJ10296 TaxID=3231908 RepID=UPI00345350A2
MVDQASVDQSSASPNGCSWALRAGDLEVRLAEGRREIDAAQALRYRIFYQEMAARPSSDTARLERDFDDYDAVADHMLVLDRSIGSGPDAVVGTYRLIRREAAARCGGFYTATEFDIGGILSLPGEVLELGRSCVDARHRTGQCMQLLWRGIAAYVFDHDIKLMFGCGSLPGVEPAALKLPLSYLHHHHLAPPPLRPRAIDSRYTSIDLMPADEIDHRGALTALPPLLKGYLRLGGMVGDGAVIDHQFNTTDVCILVKTDLVTAKYYRHYEKREKRPVAIYSS